MLKIGLVGARSKSTVLGFKALAEKVEIKAICDLDEEVAQKISKEHNIPHVFRIYEDMLMSDIDAVVIATPMQLHVPQAILALQAGKHVLSEVTAGVTMDELWWLIESVEKSGKVYMMAENYCYIPQNFVISEMIKAGLFGKLYFGEGEYLHCIEDMLLHRNGQASWRNFWQLGKRGAFYPTHSIGPVAQWFGEDRIDSIACFSSGQNRAKELGLRQDDTSLTMCQMKSGALVKIRVDCMSKRPHNMSYYSLQGTKGAYEAPRGLGDDHKVWFEGMQADSDKMNWQPLADFYDKYLPNRFKRASEEEKSAGHWGGDFFLVADFVDAVLENKLPPIDVYRACEWTAVGLLSELSVTNGGRSINMPNFRKNMPLSEQIISL
ncbi:MAG: Gfo/Idh/MocA family oxidoreductase [Clostridiales bacterium]|nr:Gfo/Idh/MocA family oxidoreductase [Clostridiales bacterium]